MREGRLNAAVWFSAPCVGKHVCAEKYSEVRGGKAMNRGIRACVLAGVAGVTVVVGSGVAFADEPVYPPVPPPAPVVQVLGETVAQPVPAAVAPVVVVKPQATLPFTGLDTIALAGVGAVLVVGGSALAFASRKRRSDSI